MSIEKCIQLIKERMEKCEEEKQHYPNCDDWFDGKKRGLLEALELVGMIGKQNH